MELRILTKLSCSTKVCNLLMDEILIEELEVKLSERLVGSIFNIENMT